MSMQLKVLIPSRKILTTKAVKVRVESEAGHFTLLPRHLDWVAALVPGIMAYVEQQGEEEIYLAVDQGILVKSGRDVLVSVRNAVVGEELGNLQDAVSRQFLVMEERERQSRTAMARLESDFVRRFMEL